MRTLTERVRPKSVAASVAGFGLVLIGSSFALLFVLDAFILDLVAVAVVLLGVAVWNGQRKAVKPLRLIMVCYALAALALLVSGTVKPTQLKLGGRAIEPHEVPWALAFAVFMGLWAMVNFILLSRVRTEIMDSADPPNGDRA